MKRNIYNFNNLLRTYNRYRRKLANLRKANKNERRQHILQNHLTKLYEKLMVLKMTVKLTTVAASVVVGTLAFIPQTANAQSFSAKEINPFSLTNSYDESSPAFADLDGDGDLDMLSGSGDYTYSYDPYTYTGSYEYYFKYYENTGTVSNPVFGSPQINPFGIAGPTDDMITPTFVDIDGDGDMDLFYGNRDGNFYYLENTGTSTAPAFGVPQTNPFGIVSYYYANRSTPTFADIDNDGDFDLLSGDNSGNFFYFENTGSSSAPAFAAYQTNPFGLSSYYLSRTAPTLIDIDSDGDFDLLSGESGGDFFYFENTGTLSAPAFAAYQTNPFNLSKVGNYSYAGRSRPTFTDIDNDGDMDLMAGDSYGDFNLYKQCTPSTATISPTAVCSYVSPSGQFFTSGGTFTDVIPNATGCDSVITINLTINPVLDQTLSSSNPMICGSGSTTIDLGSSQSGVSYYLRNNDNDTIVDGPVLGNGATISFNTDNISSATTYNVYGELQTNSTGLLFNGTDVDNKNVNCGNASIVQLSGTQITLEAWVYPTQWKGAVWGGNIINKEGFDTGYMLRCGDNGRVNFNLGNGGWNELTTSQNALVLNTWQHVAATYDGTTMSIFVDGNLVASQNTSVSFSSPNGNLTVGNWSNGSGRAFIGSIDEVKIWSVSKTQGELQTDMNTCLTGSETGLAAYYQFEDGTGSTSLTDISPNGNNGTLQNMDINAVWGMGVAICSTCNMEMAQTITINIGQPSAASISPIACDSYVSPSGNYTWTSSSTYLDTIPNVSGCDSVITVNLTINNSTTSSQTLVECAGFSVTVGTNTYNTTGVYTDILMNAVGCDSTVTTDLTVEQAIDVTVDNSSAPTLSANQTGATYQWLDCDNGNAIIPSETAQSFTATVNGNYAVEITVGSCVDTSACENISTVGVKETANDVVSIYPNPTSGMVNINLGSNNSSVNYSITSIEGKVVETGKTSTNNIMVDLSKEGNGVYFVKINTENTSTVYKLIKQ